MKKKVSVELKKMMGESFQRLPTCSNEAVDEMLSVQFFQSIKTYECIGGTPFYIAEAKLVLEGEVFVAGIPWSDLDAHEFEKGRLAVSSMSQESFMKFAETKGFVARLGSGDCIVVPGSMLVVEVAVSDSVHGLKWPIRGSTVQKKKSTEFLKKWHAEKGVDGNAPSVTILKVLESDV